MPTERNTTSIKSTLVFAVILIASSGLILAFTIFTYLQIDYQKKKIIEESIIFADIAAYNAATSLLYDDKISEKKRLQAFEVTPFIENVHLYRKDEYTGEMEFFTSYNQEGFTPVPAKFSQIEALQKPNFTGSHIELTRKIELKGELLGYIYIRGSLSRMQEFRNSSIITAISVSIATIIVSLLLAMRIQKRITQPIRLLSETAQKISKSKDYSARAPKLNIKELDILGRHFNTMLSRIQQHIEKQKNAEEQAKQLAHNLEEKVNMRTLALKDANQELLSTLEKLHQYQGQLVENEKMASLGDMVAGVAHEVNTPIGLGVTASTLLHDRLNGIRELFDEKKLTASQLEKFLNDGDENLSIIYRNLNRAAELISSFKQVAVDQSTDSNRKFNVNQLLSEVIISLQPKLKHHQHEIKVECSESLELESKPGPINQILINLIMNSVIHGFENIEKGEINISMNTDESGLCHLTYTDNGKGVSDSLRRKIFDPFVTTKRGSGGSGLGMHLVYNLVSQALGGTIQIESSEGNGVQFNIEFPVEIVSK